MLLSAFIFGLLGSFHCAGMCGPIAFMLPVSRDNKLKKFLQIFLYHVGRLIAYSIIGLVFGMLGKSLNLFGFQQQLSVIIGILMIAVIIIPAGKLRQFNFAAPFLFFIARFKAQLGLAFNKKSMDTFFTIGFLNGFLPCGLVYLAVFGAIASGGLFEGSLYMLLFGLGTIPLMTGAIYFGGMVNGMLRKRIHKLIPALVVLAGLWFILRGLGLDIPYISPAPAVQTMTSGVSCH
jgi:sulfite exporter TauE/SafE